MNLIDFLRARLDEDESGYPGVVQTRRDLAEVEAKRRIIDLAPKSQMNIGDFPDDYDIDNPAYDLWLDTLRLLAHPYADHPDFDSAWARLD